MTKRMEGKKQARAARILEVSLCCFQENGYKNATMAMIAQKADISVGSLYNYYKNKEELLLSTILATQKDISREIDGITHQGGPLEERWRLLTGKYLESFSRYGKRVWREFVAAILSETPERLRDIEHIDKPFAEGMAALLPGRHKKKADLLYRLWLQHLLRYMSSDTMTDVTMIDLFLDDLRAMGVITPGSREVRLPSTPA